MLLTKDLREFVELLISHNVEFLLVGGHAVAYHGYPRYTGDTDFLVRPSTDNATRILAALDDFGFGNVGLSTPDFATPGKIVQLGHPPGRIDLITRVTGVDFEEAWACRVEAEIDGLTVPIIGKAELIRNKRATGRAKDAADVEALEDD